MTTRARPRRTERRMSSRERRGRPHLVELRLARGGPGRSRGAAGHGTGKQTAWAPPSGVTRAGEDDPRRPRSDTQPAVGSEEPRRVGDELLPAARASSKKYGLAVVDRRVGRIPGVHGHGAHRVDGESNDGFGRGNGVRDHALAPKGHHLREGVARDLLWAPARWAPAGARTRPAVRRRRPALGACPARRPICARWRPAATSASAGSTRPAGRRRRSAPCRRPPTQQSFS